MTKTLSTKLALLAVLAAPGAAFAHHPLAGAPMTDFIDGLLSGVGHPLLGFDHLFFVVAVGIAAAVVGRLWAAPAAYIAAMAAGCLLTSFGGALPAQELAIALSLFALGGALALARISGAALSLALFAGFGLFHGAAFGETIAGQEATAGASVLIGYLLGLGVLQYGVAVAAGALVRGMDALAPRIAGAAVAGVGLFLVMEHAEGVAFAALGWG